MYAFIKIIPIQFIWKIITSTNRGGYDFDSVSRSVG